MDFLGDLVFDFAEARHSALHPNYDELAMVLSVLDDTVRYLADSWFPEPVSFMSFEVYTVLINNHI
jgi:hypothetical protein